MVIGAAVWIGVAHAGDCVAGGRAGWRRRSSGSRRSRPFTRKGSARMGTLQQGQLRTADLMGQAGFSSWPCSAWGSMAQQTMRHLQPAHSTIHASAATQTTVAKPERKVKSRAVDYWPVCFERKSSKARFRPRMECGATRLRSRTSDLPQRHRGRMRRPCWR
jgi:hypothetical protein